MLDGSHDVSPDTAGSAARALEALRRHLPELRKACPPNGGFPSAAVGMLRDIGLLAAPLRRAAGGAGLGTEAAGGAALCSVLRLIGSASMPLGRIYEAHVNALRLIDRIGDAPVRAQAERAATDGHLFALWVTSANEAVRLRRVGAGLRAVGRKSVCTGAGHATRAVISAFDERGQDERLLLIDTAGAEVEAAGFELLGMQGTATLPMRFDVAVTPEQLVGDIGDYLREPDFSAGAWRTSAVTVGGLEALVRETMRQLVARGRHRDPHQAARIGALLIARTTAVQWVEAAARSAEAEHGSEPAGAITALVNLARLAVEENCLRAIPLVQRSLGFSSVLRSNPAETLIRDLSTYLRQPAGDEALTEAAAWYTAAEDFADRPA